jgi:hypothetical protein
MKFKNNTLRKIGSLLSLGVFMLLFQNCSKLESQNSSSDNVVLPSFFSCDQNSVRTPNVSQLKRLNKFELENTLHDLFGHYLSSVNLTAFMNELEPLLAAIPDESTDDGLDYFDQRLSGKHLDTIIALSEKVAELVVTVPSNRTAVLGPCANSLGDQTCMSAFVKSFGRLAHRGQLIDEDSVWYESVFNDHASSYENLIAAMLSSPKFVYHFELGGAGSDSNNIELTAYEKAARLSYLFLQSMPDDTLLTAAESGGGLSQEEVEQNVSRLLKDPIAQKRLSVALANQIFRISHTPDIRTDIDSLNTMVSGLQNVSSLEDLKGNMIEEVYDYLHYILWEINGGYTELMTVDYVFPRTADLAEIYGTQVWDGNYSKNNLVRSPAGNRAGILTRAQQLLSGSGSTNLIIRGARVFNEFLCGALPVPADTNPPEGAIFIDTQTGREIVQAMTEVPGTSCIGCHQNIINPLGIAFENFDPLGRFRVLESVYHPEGMNESGTVLVVKPVDAKTEILLGEEILNGEINDSKDLNRKLASSEKAIACFNSHLWGFATKQSYSLGENDCATGALYKEMVTSGSIVETLKAIPLQPEFFQRKLQ